MSNVRTLVELAANSIARYNLPITNKFPEIRQSRTNKEDAIARVINSFTVQDTIIFEGDLQLAYTNTHEVDVDKTYTKTYLHVIEKKGSISAPTTTLFNVALMGYSDLYQQLVASKNDVLRIFADIYLPRLFFQALNGGFLGLAKIIYSDLEKRKRTAEILEHNNNEFLDLLIKSNLPEIQYYYSLVPHKKFVEMVRLVNYMELSNDSKVLNFLYGLNDDIINKKAFDLIHLIDHAFECITKRNADKLLFILNNLVDDTERFLNNHGRFLVTQAIGCSDALQCLKYLKDFVGIETVKEQLSERYVLVCYAAKDINFIKFIWNLLDQPECEKMLKAGNYGISREAFTNGNIETFNFLWEQHRDKHAEIVVACITVLNNKEMFRISINSSTLYTIWDNSSDIQRAQILKAVNIVKNDHLYNFVCELFMKQISNNKIANTSAMLFANTKNKEVRQLRDNFTYSPSKGI